MRFNVEQMEKALSASNIIVSVDIETTGFSRKTGGEIIEMGAVLCDLNSRKILSSFSTFVKPKLITKLPDKITRLTGIANEQLKDAPEIENAIYRLYKFIGNYPIVFHNACFDWDRFLDPLLQECGFVLDNPIIDTLAISKDILPEDVKKDLESLMEHFGVTMQGHHRAKTDAIYTATAAGKLRELLGVGGEMPDPIIKKVPMPQFNIECVKPWMSGGKEKRKRVYVTTNLGTFFYDYKYRHWYVKNRLIDADINLKKISDAVLGKLNIDNFSEMEKVLFG